MNAKGNKYEQKSVRQSKAHFSFHFNIFVVVSASKLLGHVSLENKTERKK